MSNNSYEFFTFQKTVLVELSSKHWFMLAVEKIKSQIPQISIMWFGSYLCKQLNFCFFSQVSVRKIIAKSLPFDLFSSVLIRRQGDKDLQGNTANNKIIKSMIRLFCQTASDVVCDVGVVRRDERFNHRVNCAFIQHMTWKEKM